MFKDTLEVVATVLLLAGLAAAMKSCEAHAYPENIRHGYLSCTTCHYSSSGGGPLTPYGRGAGEALATFSQEGEGDALYGLYPLPDWFYLGGDQRGVGIVTYGSKPIYIPMQADIEAGVQPPQLPGVTVDAAVGSYGVGRSIEYRRAYLKLDLSPTLSLRCGRFMPAYGVNLQDHTTLTRQNLGLDEGDESYNAELAWVAPGGEFIGDFIYGSHTLLVGDATGRYDTAQGTELSGASWRAAAYLGHSAEVGLSYLGVSNFDAWRQAIGTFAQVGIANKAYVLAEFDRKFENAATSSLGMVKLGYEVYRGLVVTAQGDAADTVREGRLGVQWWPRPHWELLLEGRRSYSDLTYQRYVDSGVLLLHHYL